MSGSSQPSPDTPNVRRAAEPAAIARIGGPRAHGLALLVAVGCAIVVTWPLLPQIQTHTMGEKFLRSYYLYWHMATHGPGEWWRATYTDVYFPDGGSGVTNGVPLYLLGAVFRPLLGPVASVNTAILLHLALTIYAGWRLSHRWWVHHGLPEVSHLAVGVGLGLTSQTIAVYANGQPENLGVGYVLLCVEGLLVWLRYRRPAALVGACVAYAFAFAMSPYLCMALLMVLGPVLLGARRRQAGVAVAALLVVTAPFAWHYSRTVQGEPDRLFCPADLPVAPAADRALPVGDLFQALAPHPSGPVGHSLDPAFLLTPPTAWGDGHLTDGTYLGWVLVGLVALAVWRRPAGTFKLLACAALPLVLGLGVTAYVNGWAPTFGGDGVPLPLAGLRAIPGLGAAFKTIQYPSRLVVGVTLPLWLLAAQGVAVLARRAAWAGVLAVALPLFEQQLLYPVDPAWLLSHTLDGAHTALAAQPDTRAVLDLPPVGFDAPLAPSGNVEGPPVELTARMVRASIDHGHPVPYRVGCYELGLYNPVVDHSGFSSAVEALFDPAPSVDPLTGLRAAAGRIAAEGFGWVAFHPGTAWSTPAADTRLATQLDAALELAYAAPDGSRLYRLPDGE